MSILFYRTDGAELDSCTTGESLGNVLLELDCESLVGTIPGLTDKLSVNVDGTIHANEVGAQTELNGLTLLSDDYFRGIILPRFDRCECFLWCHNRFHGVSMKNFQKKARTILGPVISFKCLKEQW